MVVVFLILGFKKEHYCDPILLLRLEGGSIVGGHLELDTYRGSQPESPVAAFTEKHVKVDGESFEIHLDASDFDLGNGGKQLIEKRWIVRIDMASVLSGRAKMEVGKCFTPRVTVSGVLTAANTNVFKAHPPNNKGLGPGEICARFFKREGNDWLAWSQFGDEFSKYGVKRRFLPSYLPK